MITFVWAIMKEHLLITAQGPLSEQVQMVARRVMFVHSCRALRIFKYYRLFWIITDLLILF